MIVLLTIHGIGFQQLPAPGVPGYADELHEGLRRRLPPGVLGDDPHRVAGGERGPVYVESQWPGSRDRSDPGLARVGRWHHSGRWDIEVGDAPLAAPGAGIAHVALVYSRMEAAGPMSAVVREETSLGSHRLHHYATTRGLVQMALRDGRALLSHPHQDDDQSPSLRVRTDDAGGHGRVLPRLLHHDLPMPQDIAHNVLEMLRSVEHDITEYLCSNDLRESMRRFVREAVVRLVLRPDVEGVVVNGHSKGSVVAFDCLAELPRPALTKVRGFVTAGSPLRKYIELFAWGNDAGSLASMRGEWLNFWDSRDPVADPLAPPIAWRRGEPVPNEVDGLIVCREFETGTVSQIRVRDIEVDNVRHSRGGGLRAHNYWDNDEFLEPVAALCGALLPPR